MTNIRVLGGSVGAGNGATGSMGGMPGPTRCGHAA